MKNCSEPPHISLPSPPKSFFVTIKISRPICFPSSVLPLQACGETEREKESLFGRVSLGKTADKKPRRKSNVWPQTRLGGEFLAWVVGLHVVAFFEGDARLEVRPRAKSWEPYRTVTP